MTDNANRDYFDHTEHGEDIVPLVCGDCNTPAYYDRTDEDYHHAARCAEGCFLIHAEDRPDDDRHPLYADYMAFPKASLEFQTEDYFAEVFPNKTNTLFRLHWTDGVTGDWTEHFYTSSAAIGRLALLEMCRNHEWNKGFKSNERQWNTSFHAFTAEHLS